MFASLLSLLQVTTVDCMESLSLVPLYREAPARFPLAVLESLIVLLGQLHIDQTALAKHIGGCTISIIVALAQFGAQLTDATIRGTLLRILFQALLKEDVQGAARRDILYMVLLRFLW